MSVLALVTNLEEVEPVVSWAMHFALARDVDLTVLCWVHSATAEYPLLANGQTDPELEALEVAVRRVAENLVADCPDDRRGLPVEKIQIRGIGHPDAVKAALGRIQIDKPELVVAASPDPTGQKGATYATNPLLRQSPCNTVILFAARGRSCKARKIVVGTADTPHDRVAISLAAQLTRCRADVTIVGVEENTGDEAIHVGHRELRQLLHEAGVEKNNRIHTRVLLADSLFPGVVETVAKSDLVLISANRQESVRRLLATTPVPTIGAIKRAPPLRLWPITHIGRHWIPPLNPGDYASLVQSLRAGSRFNADFMIMLGLAAAIASLGLLQDSVAVVIGSMLLAPLMTPMVGSGLALAQANPKMARMCFKSIFWGFLMTLVISFLVGIALPGEDLTPQVLARGAPNLLDLFIALCSAAAAAYAIARPKIVGAVAGVAIATALVPPLCSVGISLAYVVVARQFTVAEANFLNAMGAATLFATNLVAIILAAAMTFRAMGVVASRAAPQQRRWVYRTVGVLIVAVILLAVPLGRTLQQQVELGKAQPLAYPLPRSVSEAVHEHVAETPGVQVMLMGRSGRLNPVIDVAVYLTSEEPVPRSLADEITAIVREEMEEPELEVYVITVQHAWKDDQGEETPKPEPEE